MGVGWVGNVVALGTPILRAGGSDFTVLGELSADRFFFAGAEVGRVFLSLSGSCSNKLYSCQ